MNIKAAFGSLLGLMVIATSFGQPASASELRLAGYEQPLGVLVMTEPGCDFDSILPSNVSKVEVIQDVTKLESNSDWDMAITVERLQSLDCVEYIEPNRKLERLSEPNDNYYLNEDMWGMGGVSETAVRNSPSSSSPFGSNAIGAWDLGYTGSKDVVVAVIDEGFDFNHPDLDDNLWTNPGEIAGDGTDNDGNGVIDDIHGYDACYQDGNPDSDDVNEYHGTHVAGTIGAEGNNTYGVVGVNWNVSLMSIKIIDTSENCGTSEDLLRAYQYVIDMKNAGVNIVVSNNSYGASGVYPDPEDQQQLDQSQLELDKINEMGDAGVLFVGAAGNAAQDNDQGYGSPSSYECTSVSRDWDCIIAVGSLNENGTYSGFSNFGANTVDIAAPGSGILSTTTPFDLPDLSSYVLMDFPGNSSKYGYEYLSGTSMATPHVAGAIALCASVNSSLDPGQIRTAILDNARVLPGLSGLVSTGGILDVGAAVNDCATQPGGVDGVVVVNPISTASAVDAGFEVTWQAIPSQLAPSVSSYVLQYKKTSDPTYSSPITAQSTGGRVSSLDGTSCFADISVNGGTCTFSGLEGNTSYDIRVVATNSVGDSSVDSVYSTALAGSSKSFQFIDLGPIENQSGPGDLELPANSSSGLEIFYQASGSCEMDGSSTLALIGDGTCELSANQSGDETFETAATVSRTFEVNYTPQPQTITFPAISDQQAPGSVTLNATASSGLQVNYTTSGDCSLDSTTVSFSSAGSCSVTASQDGNDLFEAATPVTRSFSISSAPSPPPPSGGGGGGAVGSAPELLSPPMITGLSDVGNELVATLGEWDGDDYQFSYQWYRCDEELTQPTQLQVLINCDLIQGATNESYVLTANDQDKFMLVSVVASEGFYSTTGFSDTISPGESKGEVNQTPPSDAATSTGFWTKRNGDNVKIYAKNIIGLGKVQFFVNGEEIAWVRAADITDPKLRVITEGHMTGASYLVRDRDLLPGKNVFEIYVDGQRVERRIASR